MTITVVMPFHNSELTITETLASLQAQSIDDWFLIAVNDGSTDSSEKTVKEFARANPGRVRCKRIPNSGPSKARNIGMSLASTGLIALLDSDDIWHPKKLELQQKWLSVNSDAIACTCGYQIFGTDSHKNKTIHFDWSEEMLLRWSLLEGFGPGLCSSLLIRGEIADQLDGFDESISNAEDTEYSLRLASLGRVGALQEVMMYYRLSQNQGHKKANTILAGMTRVLENELFNSKRALRARARCNALTLIGTRQMLNLEILDGLATLTQAFKIRVYGPPRYLWIMAFRKLKSRFSTT